MSVANEIPTVFSEDIEYESGAIQQAVQGILLLIGHRGISTSQLWDGLPLSAEIIDKYRPLIFGFYHARVYFSNPDLRLQDLKPSGESLDPENIRLDDQPEVKAGQE